MKASTFGLICYGGVCPDLGVVLENALQAAFNTTSNLHSWREAGTVPYTKKCLLNPKVRHDGMDANDPQFDVYQDVQSQNHNSTMQLLVMGYSDNVLCAKFILEKFGRDRLHQHLSQLRTPASNKRRWQGQVRRVAYSF